MEILVWVIGFVLLFMGLYLVLFTTKFLSYDSKRLPNFWDPQDSYLVLLNWKSRKAITFIIGIVFLVASLAIFYSIYYFFHQAKLA